MDKNIIVIGHIDHGKTMFLNALNLFINGNRTERYTKSVKYNIGEDSYTLFDFAGGYEYTEKLGKNNEWAAVLVCAATDGPMPQTMEQIRLCKERGIKRIAVYLSKCDLADDEDLQDLILYDINELLEENGFSGEYPLLRASAEKAFDWNGEDDKKLFFRFLTEIHKMK